MGKQTMLFRDLFASCVNTGSTVNVNTAVSTDLLRAVIQENTVNVPWSNTVISYDVSGYTVASSVEGATLQNFYVNTGATMTVLATGDTYLSTYVSGITTIITGTTVTEVITTTTGYTVEVANSLNVSLGSNATIQNLYVPGNLVVSGTTYETTEQIVTYQYFGSPTVDGSWRMSVVGTDLVTERRESNNWVVKHTITA